MSQQHEALRLAEHLESFRSFPDDLAAAQELRRLHAWNEELKAKIAAAQQDARTCIRAELENWHIESGDVSHYEALADSLVSALKSYIHPTQQGLDALRYRALCSSGAYAPSSFRSAPWGLVTGNTQSQSKAALDAAVDSYIAAQAKQGEQE